jgi:RNA-directed DNA polymerase
MIAREKSDLPEVAWKRANKAASAAAELVERRGRAKENAELQSTVRTQSREAVSQAQARIREAVTKNRQDKLTALQMPSRETIRLILLDSCQQF